MTANFAASATAAIAIASALLAALAVAAVFRFHPVFEARRGAGDDQIRRLLHQVSELRSRADALERRIPLDGDGAAGSSSPAVPAGRELQGACPGSSTLASSFGVVGDAISDDGPALQAAIDSAASASSCGGTVVLPPGTFRVYSPIVVPGGVTLQGQGYGSSPLAIQFDAGGSTIAYCGPGHAVKLAGHAASLRDLAVYDMSTTNCGLSDPAAGGILVDADATLIESIVVSNVFVYFFLGGPALSLVAKNNGGIPFGSYHNLRIRHAKTGIYLSAEGGSFVK